MTTKEQIIEYLKKHPGATDSELEKQLKRTHQTINQACRALEVQGFLKRERDTYKGNLIGNYPTSNGSQYTCKMEAAAQKGKSLQEEEIKKVLTDRLVAEGWNVKTAWGHQHGIDIEAIKGDERWIIEVKGPGSCQAMRVNYFLHILGEALQRMDDEGARYSIALPDIEQYRRLWEKLPPLAKSRTTIGLILVSENGDINYL